MTVLSRFIVYIRTYKKLKKGVKKDKYPKSINGLKELAKDLFRLDLDKGISLDQRKRFFQILKVFNRFYKTNIGINSWKIGPSEYAHNNNLYIPDKITGLASLENIEQEKESVKPKCVQLTLF